MWLIIYDPSSGEEYTRRELDDSEVMDESVFAAEYADQVGVEIDDSDGYIPNYCGVIRVEFRDDPDNTVCIWSGESFYFKGE